MNNVSLIGNLTRDIEIKMTTTNKVISSFTLAVSRKSKNAQGDYETDFINCVAWEKTADLLNKYTRKGSKVGVTGEIRTRNYEDKNGKKVYITEILVNGVTLISKLAQSNNNTYSFDSDISTDTFDSNIDLNSDDLPF